MLALVVANLPELGRLQLVKSSRHLTGGELVVAEDRKGRADSDRATGAIGRAHDTIDRLGAARLARGGLDLGATAVELALDLGNQIL